MIADTVHDFARGATFEAVMSLPTSVPDNYFTEDWLPLSQIRRDGQLTSEGMIGDLAFKWLGPREFVLSTDETDKWPLGVAELDVLFTHKRTGRRIRTKAVKLRIGHGVTI